MVDRARMAITKWLPLSGVAAAISFVGGFIFHLPLAQIIISATFTAGLVLSGFMFQSFGREKELYGTAGRTEDSAKRI